MLEIISNDNNQSTIATNYQLEAFKNTRQMMAESAEIFLKNYEDEQAVGNEPRAQTFYEKYLACANMSNIYNQLCDLIAAGHEIEEAKKLINFYPRLNQFLAEQREWFIKAGLSQTTIGILTAPHGA